MYSSVKNLLIDLGGVLYDVDLASTLDKYRAMQETHTEELRYGKEGQDIWFSRLDEGAIEIDEFAIGLKDSFKLKGSKAEIIKIWRDLLVGLFPGRTEGMQRLSNRYQTALLSNTSRYHFETYYPECKAMFDQMDHIFVSFEMGMRKPNADIYLKALEDTGWKAKETLFFDDSRANIEAAEALGIQTCWVKTPDVFEQFIKDYGIS